MLNWMLSKLRRSSQKDEAYSLGIILTDVMDVCTAEELARGIKLHRESGKPLGQCLVSLEIVDEVVVDDAIRFQKMLRNGGGTKALLEALHTRVDRKHASVLRQEKQPRLVRTTSTYSPAHDHGLAAAK